MLTMNNLKDNKDEAREQMVLLCTSFVSDDELGLLFMELRLRTGYCRSEESDKSRKASELRTLPQ